MYKKRCLSSSPSPAGTTFFEGLWGCYMNICLCLIFCIPHTSFYFASVLEFMRERWYQEESPIFICVDHYSVNFWLNWGLVYMSLLVTITVDTMSISSLPLTRFICIKPSSPTVPVIVLLKMAENASYSSPKQCKLHSLLKIIPIVPTWQFHL